VLIFAVGTVAKNEKIINENCFYAKPENPGDKRENSKHSYTRLHMMS
jgi:hypothetical protein